MTLEYNEDIAREVEREEILEEGFNAGMEKGIEKRNIEIAKNLLKSKVDLNIISISTGISIENILGIQKELGI